jgi:hypothetical protein
MKKSELRQIIQEEIQKTINEANNSLVTKASTLYEKMLNTGDTFDIDDNSVDDTMEEIVKKVGHTPEQKKKKGFYKFAFGEFPEFGTLTDVQLTEVIKFLMAVIKNKSFGTYDTWDGKKIQSEDNEDY